MKITKKNPSKRPHVVVFGASSCPWCVKTREFLADYSVGYRYVDVLKAPKAKSLCHQHGCFHLPVIVINERWMSGFDAKILKKELGLKG